MSVREITAREASHVDTANNWIDSDVVTISIRDLREAIAKAKDLGYEEGQDDKTYSNDTYDDGYDEGYEEGIVHGYNRAIKEQKLKQEEAANG